MTSHCPPSIPLTHAVYSFYEMEGDDATTSGEKKNTNLVLVAKFHEVPVEVRLNLSPLLLQHDELLVIEVGQLVMVSVRASSVGVERASEGMASVPVAERPLRRLLDGENTPEER